MSRGVMTGRGIYPVFRYVMAVVLILAVISVCCIVAVTDSDVSAEKREGTWGKRNLGYSFDTETNILRITGTGEMDDDPKVMPYPWQSWKGEIREVVIGNGVTSIGKQAFHGASSITTVTLSETVVSIKDNAFYDCSELKNVNLTNVNSIGNGAFFRTKLDSVSSENVTSIGNKVFHDCSKLTTVDLPNATSIGNEVFLGCGELTTVSLPKVTSVGKTPFNSCSKLVTLSMPLATSMGGQVFTNNTNLTTVDFSSVESIGDKAFDGCINIKTLYLSKVTSIGERAFYECSSLSSDNLDLSKVTKIEAHAFYNCSSLKSIDLSSVTVLEFMAFCNCSSLENIILSSCRTIDERAFDGCIALSSIVFGNDLNLVHKDAFVSTQFKDYDGETPLEASALKLKGNSFSGTGSVLTKVGVKVTRNTNGGDPMNPLYGKAGEPIQDLGTPTRDGYDFAGWYSDPECLWEFTLNVFPADDVTAYAKWDPHTYTITLGENGGTSPGSASVVFGVTNRITPTVVPVWAGYHVGHYKTQGGEDITDADGYFRANVIGYTDAAGKWIKASDTVLITYWEPDLLIINLHQNGGDYSGGADVYFGEKEANVINNPGRAGYHEAGYLSEGGILVMKGTGEFIPGVDGYTDSDGRWIMPYDISLYTNWEGNAYTVTYDASPGTITPATQEVIFGSNYKLAVPIYEGHYFAEWLYDGKPLASSGVWSIASDVTLAARWTEIPPNTITFDSAGGTEVSPIVQTPGTIVAAPEAPTREGYDFLGWEPALPDVMPDHDITVVAKWASKPKVKDETTVEFDSDGEDVIIDLGNSSVADALADPTKATVAISGGDWEMSIPKEIISGATGKVSANTKTLDDASKANLPESVRERIQGKTVFSLGLSDSNGPIIFTGKKITVSLPYELPDGKNGDNVKVFYIEGDEIVQVDARYDSDKKMAVFETEHFSDWFVDVVESPSGNGGFPLWIIGVIVAVAVIAAGAFFIVHHKRKI